MCTIMSHTIEFLTVPRRAYAVGRAYAVAFLRDALLSQPSLTGAGYEPSVVLNDEIPPEAGSPGLHSVPAVRGGVQ